MNSHNHTHEVFLTGLDKPRNLSKKEEIHLTRILSLDPLTTGNPNRHIHGE